jgi:hypothetical protein
MITLKALADFFGAVHKGQILEYVCLLATVVEKLKPLYFFGTLTNFHLFVE